MFYGNFGMHVRALAYIMANGPDGLRQTTEDAVLNANYIRKKLEGIYELPYKTPTMHEVVFSDRMQTGKGVKTGDIAKRLIDYGFHPYTVSFPLVVHGALMIEPTESESKEELDQFIDAMKSVAEEAEQNPEICAKRRTTRASRAWTKPPPPASRCCAGSRRLRRQGSNGLRKTIHHGGTRAHGGRLDSFNSSAHFVLSCLYCEILLAPEPNSPLFRLSPQLFVGEPPCTRFARISVLRCGSCASRPVSQSLPC